MSIDTRWQGGSYPTVLHLIPNLGVGGTELQLLGFIERSSAPARHHIAVYDGLGALAGRAPNPPRLLGFVGTRPRYLPATFRTLSALRRMVREVRADILHAHLDPSVVLAAIAVPSGVPIIGARRGPIPYPMARSFHALTGLAHRRLSAMICCSEWLARRTREQDRAARSIRVIYNAVDLERFAPTPAPASVPTVAMVANMHPHKGHERFLRAWRRVVDETPQANALLIGDGSERLRLEHLTQSLGMGSSVTFGGRVEDVRPFVERSHVVALTSDGEGFGNALLEGMAMARPVVATRVGGTTEFVRDGEDGFLTPLDPGAIARRLVRLLGDEGLRLRMGTNARAQAERFTWDRAVRETEAVYRDVLTPR